MAKVVNKTSKNSDSVNDYINGLPNDADKEAAVELLTIFESVCGCKASMWGASIVGFGEYTYYRANGDEGTFMASGFAMRKSGPVIYIMPGYKDFTEILERLGKHKLGKSCLYLKRLSDVDVDVLKELIGEGLKNLRQTHDVKL